MAKSVCCDKKADELSWCAVTFVFGRVGLENITTSTTTLHPPPPTHREYTDGTTTSCCCCLLILAALDIFRTEQVLIWLVWERCGSVGQMGQRADLEYHNNNAGCGVCWAGAERTGGWALSFVDTKLGGKYVDRNNDGVMLWITT